MIRGYYANEERSAAALEHGHKRRFGLGQVDRRSRSDDELHDGLRDGDDRGRRLWRRKLSISRLLGQARPGRAGLTFSRSYLQLIT